MKVKEYVNKYNLKNSSTFDHTKFVDDLSVDFQKLIDIYINKNTNTITKNIFINCVSMMRDKFDSIFYNSCITDSIMIEKLWKYLYAKTISKEKDRIKHDSSEKYCDFKTEKDGNNDNESSFNRMYYDAFRHFFNKCLNGGIFDSFFRFDSSPSTSVVINENEYKEILELSDDYTKKDIENNFKRLSKKYHPDVGGDNKLFNLLLDAKNYFLMKVKNA